MIFVTVGTQLPFDRLVRAVDGWAASNPEIQVFGQIGPAAYRPSHFPSTAFLSPEEVERYARGAELIVGHAGMGTIVSSLTLRVPIIVVPRLQALREHRSNHQLATARWLKEKLDLNVVLDIADLPALLDGRHELRPGREIGNAARPRLLETLRNFVESDQREPSTFLGITEWMSGLRKLLREGGVRSAGTRGAQKGH